MPDRARKNVVLVGLMGAGKTTVGKLLATRLGWRFVDTDHEIERRTGVKIPVVFEIEGEAGFRKRESLVLADLLSSDELVIATGGGIVLLEENRKTIVDLAPTVVYLRASPRLLFARTRHDKNRPLLQVPDPLAKLESLLTEREPLYREVANIELDGDKQSAKQLVARIIDEVSRKCTA